MTEIPRLSVPRGILHALTPLILLWGALALAACGSSSPTAPEPLPQAPYSQSDLEVGEGRRASSGDFVVVDYNGYLYQLGDDPRGALFDSSLQRDPLGFTLGTGAVIDGFDRGIRGMREGGVRRLIIPPELAFGATGSGDVPPNATIVFDVALLEVRDPS